MDVFLSYARDDQSAVREIAQRLEQAGIKSWIPEKEIKPGDSFPFKIAEAIQSAASVLVFLSPKSSKSEWVNREIALALSETYKGDRKRIIPVLLDKNAEVPFFLKHRQYIDLSDPGARNQN